MNRQGTRPTPDQAAAGRARFLRFLIVGGAAATVNFGSRIALSIWLPYAGAIVVAYLCGIVAAFLLNRRYVFNDTTNRLHRQIFWFVAVNLVAIAQTLLVSLLFAEYVLPRLGLVSYVQEFAHAAGVITPIFTSYIGHKHLSFSVKEDNNPSQTA